MGIVALEVTPPHKSSLPSDLCLWPKSWCPKVDCDGENKECATVASICQVLASGVRFAADLVLSSSVSFLSRNA